MAEGLCQRPLTPSGPSPGARAFLLFLTHEFAPFHGGIARYVEELAAACGRLGWPVEVWAGGPEEDPPELAGRPFRRRAWAGGTRQGWPDRVRLAVSLIRRRREWRGTRLVLAEPGPLRLASYAPAGWPEELSRATVILHGSEVRSLTAKFWRRRLFQRLLERVARVAAVSEYTRQLLAQGLPGLTRPVELARGAVPWGWPTGGDPAGRTADGCRRVLTVARIHPRKGQLAVVEALGELPQPQRRQVRYRLVGPVVRPDYLARLREEAARREVVLEVFPDAPAAALPDHYRTADVFALASRPVGTSVEGFGLVCLEAAALGLPCVVLRNGGLSEAVADGLTGAVVDPEEPGGLTRALARILREEAWRQSLAEAGPAWAARFSWEATALALFGRPGEGSPPGAGEHGGQG